MARWRLKPDFLAYEYSGYDDYDKMIDVVTGPIEGEYLGPSMLNPAVRWLRWVDAKGKTRYLVGHPDWFEEVKTVE